MAIDLDNKRIFLIISADQTRHDLYNYVINKHITKAIINYALDGAEALIKIKSAPPNVIITDMDLAKMSGSQLTDYVLHDNSLHSTSLIIVSPLPDEEQYLDQIITGRIQFLTQAKDEKMFSQQVAKALNYSSHDENKEFHLKFLAPKDQLIKFGDKADFVYIVRKGQLRAYLINDQQDVTLGLISEGEFCGEMAYINGESRSANVEAISSCELIEVPLGTLDRVLFEKPSWSKALMQTLSRRLKEANLKTQDSVS